MGDANKDILNIMDNYIQNERRIVNELYFKAKHPGTIGGFRESIWQELFEQIIPKKFVIEQSVFIMDSFGNLSNEVDLAIFDETYTPYIFRYGKLKFLPIEAVAAVIECKSTSLKKDNLKNWAEAIAALRTSQQSYTRLYSNIAVGTEVNSKSTQTATRPMRILCCLNETGLDKHIEKTNETMFDVIIRAPHQDGGLEIEIDPKKKDLQSWYMALNHADIELKNEVNQGEALKSISLEEYEVYKVDDKAEKTPVSLLTFNLQFNQILMLVNNPLLFPHRAYAELFKRIGEEGLE